MHINLKNSPGTFHQVGVFTLMVLL